MVRACSASDQTTAVVGLALSPFLMANTCSVLANNSACNQPEKVSAAPAFGGSAEASSSAVSLRENGHGSHNLFSTGTTSEAIMQSGTDIEKHGQVAGSR
jgi:hypothetical protein